MQVSQYNLYDVQFLQLYQACSKPRREAQNKKQKRKDLKTNTEKGGVLL